MITETSEELFAHIERMGPDIFYWESHFINLTGLGLGHYDSLGLLAHQAKSWDTNEWGNVGRYYEAKSILLHKEIKALTTELPEREKRRLYNLLSDKLSPIIQMAIDADRWAKERRGKDQLFVYAQWLGINLQDLESNEEAVRHREDFDHADSWIYVLRHWLLIIHDTVELLIPVQIEDSTALDNVTIIGLEGEQARVKALVRILQGGQPMKREIDGSNCYNHYVSLLRPADRIGFSGESNRRRNALLSAYDKALIYLTDEQRRRAETEMTAIRG